MGGGLPPSTHFGLLLPVARDGLQNKWCHFSSLRSTGSGQEWHGSRTRYRPRPKGRLSRVSQGGILYPPVIPASSGRGSQGLPSVATGQGSIETGAGTMPFLPSTRRSQAKRSSTMYPAVPSLTTGSSSPKWVEGASPPPTSGLTYSSNDGFKLSTLHLRRACGGRLRLGAE